MMRVQKPLGKSGNDPHQKLGVRSCLACHRRKVRCDRTVPCTNCSKGGCACIYPTRDKDEQKSPTLQRISDRLERLELLLSRIVEPCVSATSSAEHHVQHAPSFPWSERETWELLVNDGSILQYVNNSNLRDLLQNVSI